MLKTEQEGKIIAAFAIFKFEGAKVESKKMDKAFIMDQVVERNLHHFYKGFCLLCEWVTIVIQKGVEILEGHLMSDYIFVSKYTI